MSEGANLNLNLNGLMITPKAPDRGSRPPVQAVAGGKTAKVSAQLLADATVASVVKAQRSGGTERQVLGVLDQQAINLSQAAGLERADAQQLLAWAITTYVNPVADWFTASQWEHVAYGEPARDAQLAFVEAVYSGLIRQGHLPYLDGSSIGDANSSPYHRLVVAARSLVDPRTDRRSGQAETQAPPPVELKGSVHGFDEICPPLTNLQNALVTAVAGVIEAVRASRYDLPSTLDGLVDRAFGVGVERLALADTTSKIDTPVESVTWALTTSVASLATRSNGEENGVPNDTGLTRLHTIGLRHTALLALAAHVGRHLTQMDIAPVLYWAPGGSVDGRSLSEPDRLKTGSLRYLECGLVKGGQLELTGERLSGYSLAPDAANSLLRRALPATLTISATNDPRTIVSLESSGRAGYTDGSARGMRSHSASAGLGL